MDYLIRLSGSLQINMLCLSASCDFTCFHIEQSQVRGHETLDARRTKSVRPLKRPSQPHVYKKLMNPLIIQGVIMAFIFHSHLSFYQYKDSEGTKGNITCWGLAERAFFREMSIPESTHVKHVKLSNPRNQRVEWWMPGAGGRRNEEWLINRQKVCHAKWVSSRDLLYIVSHLMNTTLLCT